MSVELQQIVGEMSDRNGTVTTVKHAVDKVLRDGMQVGILGRHDSALFCPTKNLSVDETAPIVRECQRIRDEEGIFQGDIQCRCQLPEPSKVQDAMDEVDQQDTDEDEDEDE